MCQDWVLNKKQFRNNSFIFKSSMLYSFKSLCLHIMLTSEFLLKIATFFKISSKSSANHIIFAFELTIPILWFDDIYNRQKLCDESIFNTAFCQTYREKTVVAARRCCIKKLFLKILQNYTCGGIVFFHKVADVRPTTLLKNRLRHGKCPVKFAKIFYRKPPVNVSENM